MFGAWLVHEHILGISAAQLWPLADVPVLLASKSYKESSVGDYKNVSLYSCKFLVLVHKYQYTYISLILDAVTS